MEKTNEDAALCTLLLATKYQPQFVQMRNLDFEGRSLEGIFDPYFLQQHLETPTYYLASLSNPFLLLISSTLVLCTPEQLKLSSLPANRLEKWYSGCSDHKIQF